MSIQIDLRGILNPLDFKYSNSYMYRMHACMIAQKNYLLFALTLRYLRLMMKTVVAMLFCLTTTANK